MLFLAVFLGFLAENIREEVLEKHREKQFMVSLIKDLELDTSEISKSDNFRLQKIRALDSAINILAIQSTSMVPFTSYRLSKKFYGARNFFQNSGTFTAGFYDDEQTESFTTRIDGAAAKQVGSNHAETSSRRTAQSHSSVSRPADDCGVDGPASR